MQPRPGVFGPGPPPSRGKRPQGFTLVEIAIASVIFMVLAGVVFQMFVKGSKAGAKATWRAQVTGKTRNALRQVKEAIDASSYPSMVSLVDYREDDSTAYAFTLGSGADVQTGTNVTTYTFDAQGDVFSFYSCYPRDLTPLAPPQGVPNGVAILHEFHLEPSLHYPNRLDLLMDRTSGTIDNALTVTLGSLVDSRRIATEIESVEVAVPTNVTSGNQVITVSLVSRDPVDGFMRVREESRANVNVEIVSGS